MEHRSGIQKLRIEAQTSVLSSQRSKIVNPARVMEEQRRCGISDQFGYLARELAIGTAHPLFRQYHLNLLPASQPPRTVRRSAQRRLGVLGVNCSKLRTAGNVSISTHRTRRYP